MNYYGWPLSNYRKIYPLYGYKNTMTALLFAGVNTTTIGAIASYFKDAFSRLFCVQNNPIVRNRYLAEIEENYWVT